MAGTALSTTISALSALISLAAIGISWNTATKQTYRDQGVCLVVSNGGRGKHEHGARRLCILDALSESKRDI